MQRWNIVPIQLFPHVIDGSNFENMRSVIETLAKYHNGLNEIEVYEKLVFVGVDGMVVFQGTYT